MMSKHDPQHLQDELSAYLDGELDDARRAEVEAYLRQDPQARRLVDELGQSAIAVESLDRQAAPADLVEGVLARMEREQLLGPLGSAHERDFLDVASTRPGYGRWVASAALVFLTVSVGVIVFQQSQSASDRTIVASRESASEAFKKEVNLEDLALAKADADRGVDDGAVLAPALTEMNSVSRPVPPQAGEPMKESQLRALGYAGASKDTTKAETPAPAGPQAVELKAAEAMEASPATRLAMTAEERASELADIAELPKQSTMPRRDAALAELDVPAASSVDQFLEITCATESARLDQASMIEAFFVENNIEVAEAASRSALPKDSSKSGAERTAGESNYIAMIDPDQMQQLNAMLAATAAVDAVAWSKRSSGENKEGSDEESAALDRIAAVGQLTAPLAGEKKAKQEAPGVETKPMPGARAMRPADVTIDQPARGGADQKTAPTAPSSAQKLRVQIRLISRPPGG